MNYLASDANISVTYKRHVSMIWITVAAAVQTVSVWRALPRTENQFPVSCRILHPTLRQDTRLLSVVVG